MPGPLLAFGQEHEYSFRTSVAEFLRQEAFTQDGLAVEHQFSAPVQRPVNMAVINPRRYQAWVLATAIDSADADSANYFTQDDYTKGHETDYEMDMGTTEYWGSASGSASRKQHKPRNLQPRGPSEIDDEDKDAKTTGISTAAKFPKAKASESRGSSYRRRLVDFRCTDHRTYLESLASSSSTTSSSLTPSDESSLSDFGSDAEAESPSGTASSVRTPGTASKVDYGIHFATLASATRSSLPEIGHAVIPIVEAKPSDKSDIECAFSKKAIGVHHVHFTPSPETEEEEVCDTDTITDTDTDDDDSDSAFEMDEHSDDDSDVEMRDVKWTEASKLWK